MKSRNLITRILFSFFAVALLTTVAAAQTARKHGHGALDVLHQLMLGNPWHPPAQAISP